MQSLVESFYGAYLGFLRERLAQVDYELKFFGEIYLRNINKENKLYSKSQEIIKELKREKKEIENDIRRIGSGSKENKRLVKWH